MWLYVYIFKLNNGKHYIGCTANLKERYTHHSKGHIPVTTAHLPLNLAWYCSISNIYVAYEIEPNLKSGLERAFAVKYLYKAS